MIICCPCVHVMPGLSADAAETANGAVERMVLLGLMACELIKRKAFGNMQFRLVQFNL